MNVRNGALTLREAIDSVLAQTFTDWELIVWDDRSTDASAASLPSIAMPEDPLLSFSGGRAAGQSAQAMPFARPRENGLPSSIRMTSGCRTSWKSRWRLPTTASASSMGGRSGFIPADCERDYDQAHEYELLPEGDIFTQLFTKSCFIAMSSAVFRRSAIEAIGGIPENIRIIPDYYLYVAVARNIRRARCRKRYADIACISDSMSQVAALEMHQEVLWLIDHWAGSLDPKYRQRSAASAIKPPSRWKKCAPYNAAPGALSDCSHKAR